MSREEILKIITITAEYYGRQIGPGTIATMADDLAEFPQHAVLAAYARYRKDPANRAFPMPAQIIGILTRDVGPRDLAIETAGRIRKAISEFGWNNPRDAKTFIGESGWGVIDSFGGWAHLCENLGVTINETTFYAQLRDTVESKIKLNKANYDSDRPALDQARDRGLKSASEIIAGLIPERETT